MQDKIDCNNINEIEQERIQMAMIDWHDFVVVETIDFADDEDQELPPPMTIEEVIRRSKVTAMEEEDIGAGAGAGAGEGEDTGAVTDAGLSN